MQSQSSRGYAVYTDSGLERPVHIEPVLFSADQIALQLPDELLENATVMVRDIEKRTGRSVFVLGDTSYGRCLVLCSV